MNLKIVDRILYWDRIKDSGPVYYVLRVKSDNGTVTAIEKDNFYSLEKFKDTHVSIKVCPKKYIQLNVFAEHIPGF